MRLNGRPARVLAVGFLALAAGLTTLTALGLHRPLESDAPFFLSIAQNLAAGRGYINDHSPWPEVPATDRLPAWPVTVAVLLRMMPGVDPAAVIRIAALLMNVLTAVLIGELASRLTLRRFAGMAAGACYAFYPPALFLGYEGMSEPLSALLLVAALLAVSARKLEIAAVLFGVSCLCRPNLMLLPVLAGAGMVVFYATGRPIRWVSAKRACAAAFICIAPLGVWTARNYFVTAHFPVVSTLGGLTLYGSNNAVVAGSLENWGYWVAPDEIPGETPRRTLARSLSPVEVDRYYTERALHYARAAWFSYPRLVLGKMIRGHVPLPWKPTWPGYASSVCRCVLYAVLALTLRRWLAGLEPLYAITLAALFLVDVFTCTVFYGTARFTFLLEVALLPSAVAGVTQSKRLAEAREADQLAVPLQ